MQLCKNKSLDDGIYRKWFKNHCDKMGELVKIQDLLPSKKTYFCTGIAAKIISIYIKTVEVIPTKGSSLLSEIKYPPIDSILLKNLNERHGLKLKTTWSTFKWADYEEKIDLLNHYYPGIPKWQIEVEWKVSNEEDLIIPETILQTL